MVQGKIRNPTKPLWSPVFFFFTRPRRCWVKVNMRFVGESLSIYNTLKDEEFCSCSSFDCLIDLLFSPHPSLFQRAAESICSISLLLLAISSWATKFQIWFCRPAPWFCQQARLPSATCEWRTAQNLACCWVYMLIGAVDYWQLGKCFVREPRQVWLCNVFGRINCSHGDDSSRGVPVVRALYLVTVNAFVLIRQRCLWLLSVHWLSRHEPHCTASIGPH